MFKIKTQSELDQFYEDVFQPAYDRELEKLKQNNKPPSPIDFKYDPHIMVKSFNRWNTRMCKIILNNKEFMDKVLSPYGVNYKVDFSDKQPLSLTVPEI